jgi:hypothetical protein
MDPEEEEEPWWLREEEPEAEQELEPPGRVLLRPKTPTGPGDDHPLLLPLAHAQDAVARLEALAEAASPAVAEGLRARMAYREAAGWLAHTHTWIHPQDLALRDARLTNSYGAAAIAGRLAVELPAMAAQGAIFDVTPSDHLVGTALRFAQLWRRLAELRTWSPLSDAAALRTVLVSLGWRNDLSDEDIQEWLRIARRRAEIPELLRAGRAARDWMNRDVHASDGLSVDALFLAACVWREKGFGRTTPLPFWAAPSAHHHRLALRVGVEWMAGFLDCVARAAQAGLEELNRLRRAEATIAGLGNTSRSHLPEAAAHVIKAPIITARSLADTLGVSTQGALGLIRQLLAAGIIREATGRAAWRAFVVA